MRKGFTPIFQVIAGLFGRISFLMLFLSVAYGQGYFNKQHPFSSQGSGCNPNRIYSTADGGFLIGGPYFDPAWQYESFIMELDSTGERQFQFLTGTDNRDLGGYMAQTSDGGYVFCYETLRQQDVIGDLTLLKLDADFDMEWERTFLKPGSQWSADVLEAKDQSILAMGTDNGNFIVSKASKNGDSLWTRVYGGPYTDQLKSGISVQNGGGFLLAGDGVRSRQDKLEEGMYLVRIADHGDTLWTRFFFNDGPCPGFLEDVIEVPGGFVCVGSHTFAIDQNGNLIWENTDRCGQVIRRTPDGGYCVSSFELLTKLDSTGQTVWSVPLSQGFKATDIIVNPKGDIILLSSFIDSQQDLGGPWIMKLNCEGQMESTQACYPKRLENLSGVEQPSEPVRIGPNPVSGGRFSIRLSEEVEIGEGLKALIYDAAGRLVFRMSLKARINPVSISKLKPGVYTIRILNHDESTQLPATKLLKLE